MADQLINLIFGILIFIPSILIYRSYVITKIFDFFLLAGIFFSSAIASIASVLASSYNILIFYQFNVWFINLTFLLLFFHGIRLKYKKPPKLLVSTVVSYFLALTILILFWKIQTQPDQAIVIFVEMQASSSPAHPMGAGLLIGDTIIYSTSFYLLGLLFWLFCITFLIWAYLTVEVVNPTTDILRAKRLWLMTWIIDGIWAISLFPIFPQFEEINILLLITNILILYLSLKYPESMLISNDQIVRSLALYKRIQNMEGENEIEEKGMTSLVDYLKGLPQELLDDE